MLTKLKPLFFKIVQRDIWDNIIGIKRYSFLHRIHPPKQLFVIFVDGTNYHGGMSDRFKGIISAFQFCLAKGINFRIHYTYPFRLSDYLTPNEYDWTINESDISRNILEVKYLNLVGDQSASRFCKLATKKQIHCYANRDIVDEQNQLYKMNYNWGDLFKTLFKPTKELRELINYHHDQIGGKYIGVVFRFRQLLGDFKEYNFPELPNDKKEALIAKNLRYIESLLDTNSGRKILVTSDSSTFLARMSGIKGVYVLPGKVVHMDNVSNEGYDVHLKSFLDFYMLSESSRIYSVKTAETYNTGFPFYASKINQIPFEIIQID